MAQHARTITREDLIHRYANWKGRGTTFGQAHDLVAHMNNDELRDFIEGLESREASKRGQRRAFARSQPTTSVEGQTR